MRETVTSDADRLRASLGFGEEQVIGLTSRMAALADPEAEPTRELDAPGLLNLWAVHERLGAARPE